MSDNQQVTFLKMASQMNNMGLLIPCAQQIVQEIKGKDSAELLTVHGKEFLEVLTKEGVSERLTNVLHWISLRELATTHGLNDTIIPGGDEDVKVPVEFPEGYLHFKQLVNKCFTTILIAPKSSDWADEPVDTKESNPSVLILGLVQGTIKPEELSLAQKLILEEASKRLSKMPKKQTEQTRSRPLPPAVVPKKPKQAGELPTSVRVSPLSVVDRSILDQVWELLSEEERKNPLIESMFDKIDDNLRTLSQSALPKGKVDGFVVPDKNHDMTDKFDLRTLNFILEGFTNLRVIPYINLKRTAKGVCFASLSLKFPRETKPFDSFDIRQATAVTDFIRQLVKQ